MPLFFLACAKVAQVIIVISDTTLAHPYQKTHNFSCHFIPLSAEERRQENPSMPAGLGKETDRNDFAFRETSRTTTFFLSAFIFDSQSSFAYCLKSEMLIPNPHTRVEHGCTIRSSRAAVIDPCYLGGKARFKRLNPWVVSESVSRCSCEGIRNVHLLETKSADQSFFLFFTQES